MEVTLFVLWKMNRQISAVIFVVGLETRRENEKPRKNQMYCTSFVVPTQ